MDEFPNVLASCDIYVSTSLSDAGISAATAEAMASGLPVVITDFGDNKKWVIDGENGFVIPIKDHRILAEKIVYLLHNKEERIKMGENGRQLIEEKNNYYKEMAKVEQIYSNLIERFR
jgi:glycosyltransferase involved in cell wall biosynthesis